MTKTKIIRDNLIEDFVDIRFNRTDFDLFYKVFCFGSNVINLLMVSDFDEFIEVYEKLKGVLIDIYEIKS